MPKGKQKIQFWGLRYKSQNIIIKAQCEYKYNIDKMLFTKQYQGSALGLLKLLARVIISIQ